MKITGRLTDLLPPVPASGMIRANSIAVIAELAPIDEEFDDRAYIYGTGAWGYTEWNRVEYEDGLRDAMLAYARANGGAVSRDPARMLPFIASPAVRELYRAITDFGITHRGGYPTDAAELRPYLTSPEARALAEKTFRKK